MRTTLLSKLGHPVTRCLLPLVIIAFGALIVLSSSGIAAWSTRADTALAAKWAKLVEPSAHHAENRLFTEHFFAEVGIAFIVAGLTALFVELIFRAREEREHKHRLKEIETSVFGTILGMFAPRWLSDKIIDVYKARVLREELQITYTFGPPPEVIEPLAKHRPPMRDELLTMTVEISYRLRNLTDEVVPCEIEHGYAPTVPIAHKHSGFTSLHVTPEQPRQSGEQKHRWSWREGESNRYVQCPSPSAADALAWKTRTVSVDDTLEPKEAVNVVVSYRCVRWRYDHASWNTRVPAETLKVIAKSIDKSLGLNFSFWRSHPNAFDQTPGLCEWRSKGPVLAFQGFALHWFLAPESAPK